jgi:hypothetical protein
VGAGTAFIAIYQPGSGQLTHRYVGSTIGFTAIAFGIHALRANQSRRWGLRVPAVVGIIIASLSIVVMLANLTLGAMFSAASTFAIDGIAVPPPASVSESDPTSAAMDAAASTIHTSLTTLTPPGTPYPESLAVTTDDNSVITPMGMVLGQVPAGMQLSYSPSADLMSASFSIFDPVTRQSIEMDLAPTTP